MIGAMTSTMCIITSSCSMIIWRVGTYRWINTGFGLMDVLVSSKMHAYFNGCVHCIKTTKFHICGTILRLGMVKDSMCQNIPTKRGIEIIYNIYYSKCSIYSQVVHVSNGRGINYVSRIHKKETCGEIFLGDGRHRLFTCMGMQDCSWDSWLSFGSKLW